jgi:hypothetical protein
LIGEVLGLTLSAHGTSATDRNDAEHFGFKRVNDIIASGLGNGWLVQVEDKGSNARNYPCVTVADMADADA